MGDIDFYLEERNVENLREVEKRTVIKETPKQNNKQSYQGQKKLKSLNNRLSNIESKINALEKDIKADDLELATNYDATAADASFFDRYQAKKDKLKKLMADWETVQFELDELS